MAITTIFQWRFFKSPSLWRLARHAKTASVACLIIGNLLPLTTRADDSAHLQALRTRIAALQQNLEHSRALRDGQRAQLRDIEQQIGAQLIHLKELKTQLHTQTKKLGALQTETAAKQKQLQTQLQAMADQLRTAYMLGSQEYFKMLLNQQDPARISRVFVYYRYFNQARMEHIQHLHATLTQLSALEQETNQRTRELQALRADQLQKTQVLEQARMQRGRIVASLNQRVVSQAQEIERLRRDQQRLSHLVDDIQTTLADTRPLTPPTPTDLEGRFAQYRGKLRLPVAHGKIAAYYGSTRHLGNLKWKGVLVAAPAGQDVRAVFRGRAVYADWLPGFGLLLILEHGDGYMTLYGHNQSLYKKVGDWVEAGEVIASTGNSGGFNQPGLYFEIRHNGETYDPLQWCKK